MKKFNASKGIRVNRKRSVGLLVLGLLILRHVSFIVQTHMSSDIFDKKYSSVISYQQENNPIDETEESSSPVITIDRSTFRRQLEEMKTEKNHTDKSEATVTYKSRSGSTHRFKKQTSHSSKNQTEPQINILLRKRKAKPNRRGMCLSPERYSPWILDGSCMKRPHRSTFSSTGHRRSCGFCGDDAAYLKKVRDEIAVKYEEKCKDLLVFGAALGGNYEEWLRSPEFLGDHSSKVVKRHGTCFFQFVTDVNATGDLISADGSQNLIVIDPAKMPYDSNRRNTKMLKFSPGLLFPWAKRVIWQDAKLLSSSIGNKPSPHGLPSDYFLHFNRTVQRFGTCSSFMGLPHHKVSINTSPSVNLNAHCDTIFIAAKKRPTVSDSLDVLRTQCERYMEMHGNLTHQSSQVFAQSPLVDSAFIVYDMRSTLCQKFNGDLGCSWLDEIHCYSDRDQISFPHILATSGLNLSPDLNTPGQEFRDRVYINKNNVPMLHIAKRSCHWYYRSFSRCIASEGEEINETHGNIDYSLPANNATGLRVAVIVAGTLQRFMFNSTVKHLVRPMARNEIFVDFYASLTTAKAEANRSGTGYADHLQPDPALPRSNFDDSIDIEEYLRKRIGSDLASIGALKIQESIDIDSEPMLKYRREQAVIDKPNEDPDQRFPVFDIRSKDIAYQTANANRNILRMHLAIENLWASVLKWEAEESFKYDYVMFLRDDSLWLNNFNIDNLVKKEGDIFIPACDVRDPPLDPHEISDHILISRRNSADLFGKYYSTLFQTDIKGCTDDLSEKIRMNGKRGCNSEMILKWVTDEQRLKVTKVSQGDIPFQRSANVELPDGSNMQCFHKFCQSENFPLKPTKVNKHLTMCKKIDWNALFLSKMNNSASE